MKKIQILIAAITVVPLVSLVALWSHGRQGSTTVPPHVPADGHAPPPNEVSQAPASATPPPASMPPVSGHPSVGNPPPADQAAATLPEPSSRFLALIAELRPKVDAALRASDFQAADRHVDEALTTPALEPLERQRLMVVKMASRGMRGDHAAMLTLMDEIIAVAPDSPLAANLGMERPKLEKIQRLGPNHPELCLTCGQKHAPGAHTPVKKLQE